MTKSASTLVVVQISNRGLRVTTEEKTDPPEEPDGGLFTTEHSWSYPQPASASID